MNLRYLSEHNHRHRPNLPELSARANAILIRYRYEANIAFIRKVTSFSSPISAIFAQLEMFHSISGRDVGGDDGWSHGFEVVTRGRSGDDADGKITGIEFAQRGFVGPYVPTRLIESFAMEHWQKMARDISRSTTLRRIDLSQHSRSFTSEVIGTIFGSEPSYCCPLENLDLTAIKLGAKGIAAMLPFLKSMKTLKSLNLNRSELGDEGSRLLSDGLKHITQLQHLSLGHNRIGDKGASHISDALDHVRIGCLDLSGNKIGDEGVVNLLSAKNAVHLREINLQDARNLKKPVYEFIAQFLERDETEMKSLSVWCWDVEHAHILVDSLSNNNKMEHLGSLYVYDGDKDGSSKRALYEKLQRLVCDLTSCKSLCGSNHQLTCNVFPSDSMSQKALDINARPTSHAKRLRSKLRTIFFQGDFSVQPFVGMDVVLIPFVLELVARTEVGVEKTKRDCDSREYYEVSSGNLDGIYRLVKNCQLPGLLSSL